MWTSPNIPYRNQIDYILRSQGWRSRIQLAKARPGADCGSDHELLIAKFRLKSTKVGTTTRPFNVCYLLSCVHLFVTLWTVALQAPQFMGFSRQEYCCGWSFSTAGCRCIVDRKQSLLFRIYVGINLLLVYLMDVYLSIMK